MVGGANGGAELAAPVPEVVQIYIYIERERERESELFFVYFFTWFSPVKNVHTFQCTFNFRG